MIYTMLNAAGPYKESARFLDEFVYSEKGENLDEIRD